MRSLREGDVPSGVWLSFCLFIERFPGDKICSNLLTWDPLVHVLPQTEAHLMILAQSFPTSPRPGPIQPYYMIASGPAEDLFKLVHLKEPLPLRPTSWQAGRWSSTERSSCFIIRSLWRGLKKAIWWGRRQKWVQLALNETLVNDLLDHWCWGDAFSNTIDPWRLKSVSFYQWTELV